MEIPEDKKTDFKSRERKISPEWVTAGLPVFQEREISKTSSDEKIPEVAPNQK